MKLNIKITALALALLFAGLLTGCGEKNEDPDDGTGTPDVSSPAEPSGFTYSDGIDEGGFWQDLRALDFVTLETYEGISISEDKVAVIDDHLNGELDYLISAFGKDAVILDRAVEDGDTVNIDYVGSVDGVEFDGGNTGGMGADVTIGVTQYIDDFLEQLIGHMPGETFDVNVTFPEEYGVEDLNGKDAVFVTTINHISEYQMPELTDEFVLEHFSEEGWTTAEDMRQGIYDSLREYNINQYIQEVLPKLATVSSIPDSLLDYQEKVMLQFYEGYALYVGLPLDEFLETYVGVADLDELVQMNMESNSETAKFYLIMQAIAEDLEFTVSSQDISDYFLKYAGAVDITEFELEYGMPYLAQQVLYQKVIDHISAKAVIG